MTHLQLNIIRKGQAVKVLDGKDMHPIQEHKNFLMTGAILIEDGTTGVNGFTGQPSPKRATVCLVAQTHDGKKIVIETTLRLLNSVVVAARGAFPDQAEELY